MSSFKDIDSDCHLTFLRPCYNLYSDHYILISCFPAELFTIIHKTDIFLLKHLHIEVEITIDHHSEFQMKQKFCFVLFCYLDNLYNKNKIIFVEFHFITHNYLLKADLVSVTMNLMISLILSRLNEWYKYLLIIYVSYWIKLALLVSMSMSDDTDMYPFQDLFTSSQPLLIPLHCSLYDILIMPFAHFSAEDASFLSLTSLI